jgi:hypothetical protein
VPISIQESAAKRLRARIALTQLLELMGCRMTAPNAPGIAAFSLELGLGSAARDEKFCFSLPNFLAVL